MSELLQVGDILYGYQSDILTRNEVTKVTPKQAYVNGSSFYKVHRQIKTSTSHGRERSVREIGGGTLYLSTPEFEQRFKIQSLRDEAELRLYKLKIDKDMTEEQLNQMVSFLKSIQP